MLTYFFKILKKVIFAAFLIYSFDIFAVSFDAVIPINFITVMLVCLFDVSAMVGLLLFSLFF